MYGLIYESADYTNIKFITHEQIAMEEYLQVVEDAREKMDTDYCRGIALIKIKGDGNFQVGMGFSGDGNVEIVESWEL